MSDSTVRAVEIHNLLLKETDPTHPMNSNQIISRIYVGGRRKAFGRKAVYSSMTYIQEANEHVKKASRNELGWYMEHDYTEADVCFFGNVLSKIRCISAREKKSVRTRFKDVVFPNARQYLNMDANTCFVEESSTGTMEYILAIQNAIIERKKILFYYITMDEYMRPIRKYDGKLYKVSPYYMFFSAETMYLFAAEDNSPIIKTYRVDRMDRVEKTNEKAISSSKYMKGNPQKELRRRAAETIDNFDGPEIAVYLDVPYTPTAMNIIADCVGKNAEVVHYDKETGHDLIRINVRRSPTLTSWLYQNIEFFSVISPQCIIDDVVERSVWNIKAYSTT